MDHQQLQLLPWGDGRGHQKLHFLLRSQRQTQMVGKGWSLSDIENTSFLLWESCSRIFSPTSSCCILQSFSIQLTASVVSRVPSSSLHYYWCLLTRVFGNKIILLYFVMLGFSQIWLRVKDKTMINARVNINGLDIRLNILTFKNVYEKLMNCCSIWGLKQRFTRSCKISVWSGSLRRSWWTLIEI